MARKLPGRAIQAGTISVTQLETAVANTVQTGGGPKITNVQVTSNSYVVLDDTAVDIAGGYIKITGTGFAAGCQVLINNTPATSTTFIGPTEVRAQLPASSAGTYMLYLINADGGVAIRVNGVTFSATPSWVTASDLTSYALGDAISIQLSATGASTFALAAGSTLPTGLTLSAGGLLSGSVTGLENDTSYSFTITATDAENQDSPRTFSITITVQLQVSRSLRFNSADSAYLVKTFPSAGNRKTWTFSAWIKRSQVTTTNGIFEAYNGASAGFFLGFRTSTDDLAIAHTSGFSPSWGTAAKLRDPSAWYHIVAVADTTSATSTITNSSTDRLRLYVNGVQQTLSGGTVPSQNEDLQVNSTMPHHIGRFQTGSFYSDQYITEVYFIDGQALTPAAFAETNNTTGQYIPKKYTGTYGTNGFYLPFTDNSSVANLGRNYQPLTADPFWNRTVLLLNGTGTNNANNNTFIDSSTNAFAITRNGNTTQGRFSPFTQGGWSNYFDGTANGSLRADSSTDTNLSGDFTIQAWVYPTANGQLSNSEILSRGAATTLNGWHFGLIASTTQLFFGINYASSGNTSTNTQSSTNIPLNQWTHVAVTRSGNTCRIYINGVVDTTNTGFTGTPTVSGTEYVYVGRASYDTTTRQFIGYINNASIIKGTALTTFSQTQPLATGTSGQALLTCTANRFIDTNTATTAKILTAGSGASVTAFSPFTPTTAYSAATNGGSGYFDGTGDYLSLPDSVAMEFGSGDFTCQAFVYLTSLSVNSLIFGDQVVSGSLVNFGMNVLTSGAINVIINDADAVTSTAGDVTVNQWTHIACSRTGGTLRIFKNGSVVASAANSTTINAGDLKYIGYQIYNTRYLSGYVSSLMLEKGVGYTSITVPTAPVTAVANTSLLLNFVNAGIVDATGDNNIETVGDAKISTAQSKWAGSSIIIDNADRLGTKKLVIRNNYSLDFGTGDFTIEAWIYLISLSTGNNQAIIASGSGGVIFVVQHSTNVLVIANYGGNSIAGSTALSAGQWYHVAATRNSGTTRLFLNGTATVTSSTSLGSLVASSNINVGQDPISNLDQAFNGYIQDLRITRAARYTGNFTPPTAQFAYNQGDINYNQWVPTNFSVTAGAGNDSLLDVPTNWGVDTGLGGEVRGNYCTWNQLDKDTNATISNGGLDLTAYNAGTYATWPLYSGKWYYEITLIDPYNGTFGSYWGIHGLTGGPRATASATTATTTAIYCNTSNDQDVPGIYVLGTRTIVYRTFANNDVLGFAIDMDARTMTITRNGVAVATNVTIASSTPMYIWSNMNGTSGDPGSSTANFGQRPFAYAAPSGFKSLNTHNLPALAVTKSNTAFDTVLYTGNGSTQTIGGLNFAPDLVWIKDRSSSVVGHRLYDTIRGATKEIYTHSSNAETTDAAGLTAFTANGFTTGNSAGTNTNGDNLVAWAWDAGTTTVVNTAGSITANVRVNSAAGFSIARYTGTGASASFGHGLGVAPKLVIIKSLGVEDWFTYVGGILGGSPPNYVKLNTTAVAGPSSGIFPSLATSSVVNIGSGSGVGANGITHIAYSFAEVPGFSAFGTYTGNGSTDGPFVYLGFRPKFLLTKRADSTSNWLISDAVRNSENPVTRELYPNAPDSEPSPNSAYAFDFLSNGVKLRRATDSSLNILGGTYIYAAFAESPFKYARAR